MTEPLPAGASSAPPPSRPRARPGIAARLGCSLGLVVGIFGALELGCRLVGAGDPMAFGGSRLLYQQIYPPLFATNAKGRLEPRDPRLVDRSFPAQAPPERVFVFGESAVKGLGMCENASFSRALERQLRNAGLQHSVVNCGIVALDSRQIIACVKDVATILKPDDWVVLHVGNNEFLETHAWRFLKAKNQLPFAAKVDDVLRGSRLYLAIKNAGTRGRTRRLTPEMFSIDALRGIGGGGGGGGATEDPGSERELVKRIEAASLGVTPEEIAAAAATHKAHMRTAIELAKAAGAKVVLMTVATNLEWEGVSDPAGGWVQNAVGGEPLGKEEPSRTARLQAALEAHERALKTNRSSLDRWHALYERAWLKRALGDAMGAREDFQRANDEDPHLRRCLAVMNENMRALAKEESVALVDGERIFSAASRDGIPGFDVLYDYVHFTPEGSEQLAAALAKAIAPSADPAKIDAFVAERRAKLAARTQDALEVEEYYGWDADRSILSDRDLWKYDKQHDALDHVHNANKKDDAPDGKIQAGTATPEEIVWAADFAALQVSGEAHARELYAKARAAKPDLAAVIDSNLRWLDSR